MRQSGDTFREWETLQQSNPKPRFIYPKTSSEGCETYTLDSLDLNITFVFIDE